MGITATDLDLLLELRHRKKDVSRIATIGRLSLYLHPQQITRLRGIITDSKLLTTYRWGDAAEPFLCDLLGARKVVSIDISKYQDSSIVHDMNQSLVEQRPDLAGQFDLVIDGGTLEHIFNFPIAIENLMFLVPQNGYILSANPANNLCGHGFYQFTPELMYRIYSAANGFCTHYVILTQTKYISVEMDPYPKSFMVVDPASLGFRINLRNSSPVMIRVLAERVEEISRKRLDVMQSDYVKAWRNPDRSTTENDYKTLKHTIFRRLPRTLQSSMLEMRNKNSIGDSSVMQRYRGKIE